IDWLKNERDSDKPFFITVWTHEPHLPIESDPEYQKHYADIENPGIRQHHGNVTQLDHAFGMLMEAVDELKLRDNTFVMFTSDNGPEGNGKGDAKRPDSQRNRTWGSTGGLRGRKRDSHEGGIRVPGIVRWPGKIDAGTESAVPVIGSDIFSTVLDIVDIPLPDDRTIDGVSMVPAFQGKSLERPVPLFWRTHIAPPSSHAAMRIGDWKIVADVNLEKFQLYDIQNDWQETKDLASENPEKLEEMKAKFIEVWDGVEEEGPSEWWKNISNGGSKKKSAPIADGKDHTGDFDVVKGAEVKKTDFGYLLDSEGEGFALQKLETPVQEMATFKLKFRTATESRTKNACFCFGAGTKNDQLFKAGSLIGMGKHVAFDGTWVNTSIGATKSAQFDPNDTFEAEVTIDLDHGKLILQIGDTKIQHQIPSNIESVNYIGYYAKGTKSEFSEIERVE
ncbi:MAG: sulfatase-like hydrolase/transferase, partial [Verrucomicrobiota bacterium]